MAKDKYHEVVKNALINDGWVVTDDPLHIESGGRTVYIDLAAEKFIIANKGTVKIAVEVKSFLNASPLTDFYSATGKYLFYQRVLDREGVARKLYLAIPDTADRTFFQEPITQELVQEHGIQLIVYNIKNQSIQWKK